MIYVFFVIIITDPLKVLLSNKLVAISHVDVQIWQYTNILRPKYDRIKYKRYEIGSFKHHCGSNRIPNRVVYIATT